MMMVSQLKGEESLFAYLVGCGIWNYANVGIKVVLSDNTESNDFDEHVS